MCQMHLPNRHNLRPLLLRAAFQNLQYYLIPVLQAVYLKTLYIQDMFQILYMLHP